MFPFFIFYFKVFDFIYGHGCTWKYIKYFFLLICTYYTKYYNLNPNIFVEWLLVTSGIIQGLISIFIAYWGNRIHRISWMGGILILQSLLSLAVIIPILTNRYSLYFFSNDKFYIKNIINSSSDVQSIVAPQINQLCTERTIENLTEEITYSVTTLIMLFVLQFGIALGNIAYYTLGLSYLDDNVLEHHSPAVIGNSIFECFCQLAIYV